MRLHDVMVAMFEYRIFNTLRDGKPRGLRISPEDKRALVERGLIARVGEDKPYSDSEYVITDEGKAHLAKLDALEFVIKDGGE